MHRPRSNTFVLSIAVLALALASTAVAATGGGKGGKDPSSISLVMVSSANASLSPNSAPSWGDTVTFNVSTTATTQPSVVANCYQNGALVYTHYGFFYGDQSPSQNFVLKSSLWTGGAADCTATLYYINAKRGTEVDLSLIHI